MTKLPVESWNIKPRLDLPPYELNEFCPITGEVPEPGSHHIVRKSFTALGKEKNDRLYWVELDDGEVIGNRIRLSSQAHYRITTNRAAIVYANGVYYWEEAGERVPLRWQPPTLHQRKTEWDPAGHEKELAQAIASGAVRVLEAPVEPGHDCPTCNRRVPLPKKASSPSTKVFSCRIPIDDAETFSEIVDAAAEHAGMKSRPHHVYNVLLVGLALLLQAPKEDLPDVG